MNAFEFSNPQGVIRPAPLEAYQQITDSYLAKIEGVEAIKGVVKIGSVTCPGLSDIDLFIILDNSKTPPDWNQLSISDIAANHPNGDIIAHDVFVIPENIADNIGAFFYVDNQQILRGEGFSSINPSELSPHLLDMITLEYTCHRLEALFHLLVSPVTSLRTALLLVSTIRHTADMAMELGLITDSERQSLRSSIEALRSNCMDSDKCGELLAGWPDKCFDLLWKIAVALGDKLHDGQASALHRSWRAGPKTTFHDVDSEAPPHALWESYIQVQTKSKLGKYVKTIPMPAAFHQNVARYLGSSGQSAAYFAKHFPNVGSQPDSDNSINAIRATRMDLVKQHWDFINNNGYHACSGKGYFGLNMPGSSGLKMAAYSTLNRINATLLSTRLPT